MSVYVLEMSDPIFNSFWLCGFLREAVDIYFHLNLLHFVLMENHDGCIMISIQMKVVTNYMELVIKL